MFNVIQPTDPIHSELAGQLDQIRKATGVFDYNGLTRAYNEAPIGAIINFPYSRGKVSALVTQLLKRGLKRDQEFTLVVSDVSCLEDAEGAKPDKDGGFSVETSFITRLSDKQGEILVSNRGRVPFTEEQKVASKARREEKKSQLLNNKVTIMANAPNKPSESSGGAVVAPGDARPNDAPPKKSQQKKGQNKSGKKKR